MNNYYEGFVRARRTIDDLRVDHRRIDEVVIRHTVRFRVGLSLVSLGQQLMGVTSPTSQMRSAA